jgi:hypothetical protein
METLNRLVSNPLGLCLVLFLVGFVVANLMMLVSMLSRKPALDDEFAAKWGKAFRGGFDAQKKQQADLDDLHRRVSDLEKSKPE